MDLLQSNLLLLCSSMLYMASTLVGDKVVTPAMNDDIASSCSQACGSVQAYAICAACRRQKDAVSRTQAQWVHACIPKSMGKTCL